MPDPVYLVLRPAPDVDVPIPARAALYGEQRVKDERVHAVIVQPAFRVHRIVFSGIKYGGVHILYVVEHAVLAVIPVHDDGLVLRRVVIVRKVFARGERLPGHTAACKLRRVRLFEDFYVHKLRREDVPRTLDVLDARLPKDRKHVDLADSDVS